MKLCSDKHRAEITRFPPRCRSGPKLSESLRASFIRAGLQDGFLTTGGVRIVLREPTFPPLVNMALRGSMFGLKKVIGAWWSIEPEAPADYYSFAHWTGGRYVHETGLCFPDDAAAVAEGQARAQWHSDSTEEHTHVLRSDGTLVATVRRSYFCAQGGVIRVPSRVAGERRFEAQSALTRAA